ncbi:Uncharacterized protein DAT39_019541, partial [Clarias magur]
MVIDFFESQVNNMVMVVIDWFSEYLCRIPLLELPTICAMAAMLFCHIEREVARDNKCFLTTTMENSRKLSRLPK